MLHAEFPNDKIMGEESSEALRSDGQLAQQVLKLVNLVDKDLRLENMFESIDLGCYSSGKGRFWTIDPIDGTKGFLRGGQYAICLALIENGQSVVAAQACPNLPRNIKEPKDIGSIFYAARNQGAFEKGYESKESRISVSNISNIENSVFCESAESSHSSHLKTEQISKRLNIKNDPIRIDSQCKYGLVARGDANIFLRIPTDPLYEEKIWDHACGCLLVEESGGVVTDLDDKPLDFSTGRTLKNNRGILATNTQEIHSIILKQLS